MWYWISFRFHLSDLVMETQPKKDNDLTLDILTEFIEVLIHQVLHMRYIILHHPHGFASKSLRWDTN